MIKAGLHALYKSAAQFHVLGDQLKLTPQCLQVFLGI